MPKRTTVHGFYINYEQEDYEGIRYLREDLDYKEARVFFDQARMRGKAPFEDDNERQFTVVYKKGDYTLLRR